MTNTHTKVNGSLASWTLVASSDGKRGRTGYQKQYVVAIRMLTDGKFVVSKYWGKAETHFSELATSEVGVYGSFYSAKYAATEAVNAKIGKYSLVHSDSIELVNA